MTNDHSVQALCIASKNKRLGKYPCEFKTDLWCAATDRITLECRNTACQYYHLHWNNPFDGFNARKGYQNGIPIDGGVRI